VQAKPLSLEEKCKKLEETNQRAVTNTIGYTRKQSNKEWFVERVSHPNQNQNSQECLQTSPVKREAFIQKKGKAAQRRGFNRD
jgi:hypothetical protein